MAEAWGSWGGGGWGGGTWWWSEDEVFRQGSEYDRRLLRGAAWPLLLWRARRVRQEQALGGVQREEDPGVWGLRHLAVDIESPASGPDPCAFLTESVTPLVQTV